MKLEDAKQIIENSKKEIKSLEFSILTYKKEFNKNVQDIFNQLPEELTSDLDINDYLVDATDIEQSIDYSKLEDFILKITEIVTNKYGVELDNVV